MIRKIGIIAAALSIALTGASVHAKVSEEDAKKLGGELTPMGAIQAANADGSIPAWTGGITSAPEGYSVGDHHPNPYPGDKVLFEITASNYKEYADFLSEGQKKLFEAYPDTYRMPVYQTRRSASNPQAIYDATKVNATSAELLDDGNGIKGAVLGIPFPMPKTGMEAIWNHILRYRGAAVERNGGQAAVTTSGDYNVIGFDEQLMIKYAEEGATPEKLTEDNILFMFKQKVTKPARLDMFNGSPNRYNWKLVGKKEMFVAYNNYALHSDNVSYDEILHANHVNPDLTRWEKHRVWVVEATLKEGFRHIYQKRVFFIDEDSWQIQVADMYDNRGELYRVGVAYGVNYYEVPTQWSTLDAYYDLNSRRYLAIGLDNEEQMYDFSIRPRDVEFTPQALRREGKR